jgi:fluoride ion exporter CrcB/FEX
MDSAPPNSLIAMHSADSLGSSPNRTRGSSIIVRVHPASIVALISGMAMLGTLFRLLITVPISSSLKREVMSQNVLISLLGPQILGCFVMGMVKSNRAWLAQLYGPLFLGLGTGLCGSITTYSSSTFICFKTILSRQDWGTDQTPVC